MAPMKTATVDLVKVNPIATTRDMYDVVVHAINKIEELGQVVADLEAMAATVRKDSTLFLAELESVLQFLDPQ